MSKQLLLVAEDGSRSDTYLHLEDEVMTAVHPILENHPQCHMSRALLDHFYGDEEFPPDQAAVLATECAMLATLLQGSAKTWLEVIAALAAGAAEHQLTLRADAG